MKDDFRVRFGGVTDKITITDSQHKEKQGWEGYWLSDEVA